MYYCVRSFPVLALCVALYLFPQWQLPGQTSLSSDQYFGQIILEFERYADAGGNTSFRPSWLDEIDLRTESRNFDPDRQRYLLRISPTTGKIRKAQSRLHQGYQAQAALELEEERRDWIEDAYDRWLKVYDNTRKLELQQQLLQILTDQQSVVIKLAAASEASVKEVIEIGQDINEIQIDIFALERALESLLPNAVQADFSDLISIEDIRQRVLQTRAQVFSPAYPDLEQDLRDAEAEIQLEKAEGKRIFDFFQLEYAGPHEDPWREKVNVGLGVNISLSSDRKLKIEELNLEKKMIEQQTTLSTLADTRRLNEHFSRIDGLFQTLDYALGVLQASNRQSEALVEKSSPDSFSTPSRQLYQKELVIKNELQLLKIEQDIYEEYIRLLVINDSLFQQPFLNYLKK